MKKSNEIVRYTIKSKMSKVPGINAEIWANSINIGKNKAIIFRVVEWIVETYISKDKHHNASGKLYIIKLFNTDEGITKRGMLSYIHWNGNIKTTGSRNKRYIATPITMHPSDNM